MTWYSAIMTRNAEVVLIELLYPVQDWEISLTTWEYYGMVIMVQQVMFLPSFFSNKAHPSFKTPDDVDNFCVVEAHCLNWEWGGGGGDAERIYLILCALLYLVIVCMIYSFNSILLSLQSFNFIWIEICAWSSIFFLSCKWLI